MEESVIVLAQGESRSAEQTEPTKVRKWSSREGEGGRRGLKWGRRLQGLEDINDDSAAKRHRCAVALRPGRRAVAGTDLEEVPEPLLARRASPSRCAVARAPKGRIAADDAPLRDCTCGPCRPPGDDASEDDREGSALARGELRRRAPSRAGGLRPTVRLDLGRVPLSSKLPHRQRSRASSGAVGTCVTGAASPEELAPARRVASVRQARRGVH